MKADLVITIDRALPAVLVTIRCPHYSRVYPVLGRLDQDAPALADFLRRVRPEWNPECGCEYPEEGGKT